MRVHFIEEDINTILFLPDSLRFYKINKLTKNIIQDITKGESSEEILSKYSINIESYNKIIKLLKEDELEVVTAKREDALFKLVLNVTNKCNLACKYCYANGGNYCSEESIMTKETAKKALDIFFSKYKNIKTIQFFGGEPTLNLDVIEYVCNYFEEKLKSNVIDYKPNYGIVTNGTNVSNRFLDLVEKYNLQITISLDGPGKVNDKMRVFKNGKGTSSIIVNNIKSLKSKADQPTSIEATYNKAHIDEDMSIKDVIKYFKDDLGIKQVHLVPVSGERGSDFLLDDINAFENAVFEIFKEKNDSNRDYTFSLIDRVVRSLTIKKTSKYLCEAGISNYSVSVQGDVYPCFMLTDIEEFKLGNVYEGNLFLEDKYHNVTKNLEKFSKFKNSQCEGCFNNKICTGCLGSNYFQTGNIHLVKEEECKLYKTITEKVILELVRSSSKGA